MTAARTVQSGSGTLATTPRATAPQLTGTELLQVKWLLGSGLILLSASTVLYLDLDGWTLMSAIVVAVIAGLTRPAVLARIPAWAHRLAFPGIVTAFTLDLWLTGELLPPTVRLDLLLLLYRSITYRQRRDELQVIVLGLFLIVLAGVLTVSLTFAVHLLAFAAGALSLLLTITLLQALEVGTPPGPPPAPGEVPVWARQVRWPRLVARVRAVTRWRVVAFGAALFAGLVVLSALLFVAIPRFQLESGFFLERFVTKKARTGFSDTIRFGEVTEITQDNSVALNVDVADRRQLPAAPYWRMLVLDEYRSGTFHVSPALRRMLDAERTGAVIRGGGPARKAGGGPWTFYFESGVSRFLPLPGRFAVLRFQEPQNYFHGRSLGIVSLRVDPVTMLAYRVEGLQLEAGLADPTFAARLRAARAAARITPPLMLDSGLGPDDDAELGRLAEEIAREAPRTAPAFAQRAVAWLAQRHGYSLQPAIPGGAGDPLLRWLRGDGGGHCELFAGSLVLLARRAGWPARVATGFRGGSWNGYSNSLTLRNSDAHAWCEIFDELTGSWLRVDPTPGAAAAARVDERDARAFGGRPDRSWTARVESLRVFWYRRVVNFDQQSQIDTLLAVREATAGAGRRLRLLLEQWTVRWSEWRSSPWTGSRVAIWIAAVAGVGVFSWLLRRHRFDWAVRFGRSKRRLDRVRLEAAKWLRRLQGGGVSPDDMSDLVADLQRIRFGPKPTWPEPAAVFRRARRAARAVARTR